MMNDEEYEDAKKSVESVIVERNLDGLPKIGSPVQVVKPFQKKDPTFPKNIMGKTGIVMAYKVELESHLLIVRINGDDYELWDDEVTGLLI